MKKRSVTMRANDPPVNATPTVSRIDTTSAHPI